MPPRITVNSRRMPFAEFCRDNLIVFAGEISGAFFHAFLSGEIGVVFPFCRGKIGLLTNKTFWSRSNRFSVVNDR